MKQKLIFYTVSLFFLIIILFGSYKIFSIAKEHKTNKDTYNTLKEHINNNIYENEIIWPTVDFASLKNINQEIIAWISLKELNIDYPVVQGSNNNYYLKHMANKEYNQAGSIYMDYKNNSNLEDKHTIIYGHNNQDNTMFSNLTKYKEQSFYDNNPYYLLITENTNYKVDIIAGYVTDTSDNSWKLNFKSEVDFESWISDTINKSLIKSSITPTTNDKFITLSTCSYEFDNARFVLVGILKEQ